MSNSSMPRGGGSNDFLFERLREEVSRATRHNLPLALMVFHVKAPGVTEAASRPLLHAATMLARAMVRHSDVVASLGDRHFGVVANTTRDGAATLAKAVARELEAFEFTCGDRQLSIEVGYGLSSLDHSKTPRGLLEEARAALGLPSPSPELQEQR